MRGGGRCPLDAPAFAAAPAAGQPSPLRTYFRRFGTLCMDCPACGAELLVGVSRRPWALIGFVLVVIEVSRRHLWGFHVMTGLFLLSLIFDTFRVTLISYGRGHCAACG